MKESTKNIDVIIVGGGLAGLCNAIHLSKHGKNVVLIEKNSYPKHKVCGEYISNEILPYLNFLGIDPFDFGAVSIKNFQLSTAKSKLISASLPLGGFGISRYQLDFILAEKAKENRVSIIQDTVVNVNFIKDEFIIETKENQYFTVKVAIGAFGKRSLLDVKMQRKFIQKKSQYLAVKTHVKGHFREDLVALHNFNGGYCGVSKVENDRVNLCYITSFKSFKKYKNVDDFQEQVVFKNTYLKAIFQNSEALFEKPLTISQISFETKSPIENHLLMSGDAAGMIHPLCGNGMSMAIQSAHIAAPLVLDFLDGKIKERNELEKRYLRQWNKKFRNRLRAGHFIAWLFRNIWLSGVLLELLKRAPFLLPMIIKQTHGKLMKL